MSENIGIMSLHSFIKRSFLHNSVTVTYICGQLIFAKLARFMNELATKSEKIFESF